MVQMVMTAGTKVAMRKTLIVVDNKKMMTAHQFQMR